ncbi:mechanosensitive ion channel [Oligella ureolytica]
MSELANRYLPMLEVFLMNFVGAIFILIIGWTISNVVAKATRRIGPVKA